MTASQRFGQRLPDALADLAQAPYPTYIDDVLVVTSRTRRRPAWQFPGRWLPIEIRAPLRPVLLLGVLALLLLGLLVAYIGSQQPTLPNPFGLAANGLVVFSAEGEGYVATLDGPARVLIEGPGDELGLNFSLDGTRISFIRLIDGKEYLWIANSDGTNQVQLIDEPIDEPGAFVWSPSGDEIALTDSIDGTRRIVIVKSDGSSSRVLDLDFPATDPSWRPPDGQELLVRRTDGGTGELYVVAADGSSVHSLGVRGRGLYDGAWDAGGASWSPDGSLVAYHNVDGGLGAERFRVHVVRADGTDDRVLTLSPVAYQEAWPLWSPDGKAVAIQRWLWEGDSQIAILPIDGSGATPSIGPRHRFEPSMGWATIWSPDAKHLLVFWDARTGAYLIDPVTGDSTKVDLATTDRLSWQRVAP